MQTNINRDYFIFSIIIVLARCGYHFGDTILLYITDLFAAQRAFLFFPYKTANKK